MSDPTFTFEQATAAQARLRSRLGLREEVFPTAALVGMLSDEIEKMRAAGHSDDVTAALIEEATGRALGADAIRRFYVPPDQRRRRE